LDFALCLIAIENSLMQGAKGYDVFEFTESDAKLLFQKKNDIIKINTSFSDDVLEVLFTDFQREVHKFYKNVISDILIKNSDLINNHLFFKYLNT
jgi:hypothetical protein